MTDSIRVLQCIARMNAGGTALLLDALMRHTNPDVEQLLLYGQCEPNEIDFLQEHPPTYAAQYLPQLGRRIHPVRDLLALFGIRRAIINFKPTILHTHTFKAGLLGRLAAVGVSQRPTVVHTFHGHLLSGYFSRPVTYAITKIERALARVSKLILTVGPQIRDDLLAAKVGRAEQYRVVIPGVADPTPLTQQEARSALGLDPDRFTISFVGRLTHIKRVDRFLQSLALLNFPFQAVIAGDGEQREEVEKLATELGVPVTFLGWRDDVDSVYYASDVIALTSDNEGLGLVLVEAQLRGRPVVATAVGGVSAALIDGETGFLVTADPRAIAAAINKVAQLPPTARQQMSERAVVFAEEHYSLKRFAQEHQRIYHELAGFR